MTVKLIGTSHLASSDSIKEVINREKPDIIAVEMCKERYDIHMKGKIRKDKSILTKIANKMTKTASQTGNKYGNDMVTAMKIAEKRSIPLKLIDRHLDDTKRKLKKLPFREKLLLWASYKMMNKKKMNEMKEKTSNLNKQKVDGMINKVKVQFPTLYEILIVERNAFLYENIRLLKTKHPQKKILVFLGAGHVSEINNMLKENDQKRK